MAAGLCAAALVATAPAASADTDRIVTGTTNSVGVNEISGIDTSRAVSFTVIKTYSGGTEGVPGVPFTLRRVKDVDLGTQSGWEKLESITPDDFKVTDTRTQEDVDKLLEAPVTATTDAQGHARFNNLPVGLYYLVEDKPATAGAGYTQSAPMLLTLPLRDAEGEKWAYNFTVNAKNQPTKPGNPTYPPGEETPFEPPVIPSIPDIPGTPTTPENPGEAPGTRLPSPPLEEGEEEPPSAVLASPHMPGVLASTGASVIGIVVLGVLLLGGGFLLTRRRKEEEEEQ